MEQPAPKDPPAEQPAPKDPPAEQPAPKDPPADDGTRRTGRAPVLHTFLLAAYPVLFLYGANAGEVALRQVVGPLLAVLAGAAALLALLTAVLRDVRRAGLIVSVMAVSVFGYGHVANVTEGGAALLVVWLVATAGLCWLAARGRTAATRATRVLNVVALALVAAALVTVAPAAVADLGRGPTAGGTHSSEDGSETALAKGAAPARDIYYLVLDRYANAGTLERGFGFDNSRFLSFLRDHSFVVADHSHANYLKSAQSIASALNMEYHHAELAARYGPESADQLPVYELLARHRVGLQLQRLGYTYVHIGSWWDPTQTNELADFNLGYGGGSDFSEVLYDTTVASAVAQAVGASDGEQGRQRHRDAALEQFDALAGVADLEGPTFVFAHILLPHEPYVFDRDGDVVSEQVERSRTREENYTEQLHYTNARLRQLVTELLDRPEAKQPIIVIQGDEGPHPVRYTSGGPNFDWAEAEPEDLAEKLGILNAYHLPGVDVRIPEDITPVNTFRIILNAYFDADLPLLDNRSYVFRNTKHVYDYTEVTDRLPGP